MMKLLMTRQQPLLNQKKKDKLFGNPDYNVVTEEKSVLFAVKVADTDNAARAAVSEYALAFTKIF